MALVKMTAADAKRKARVDRKKLRATTESDIRRHMIEDGFNPGDDLFSATMSPAQIRAKFKMTQAAFARTLQVPLATIRNWEQERTVPDPAARTLLKILDRSPSAMHALTRDVRKNAVAKASSVTSRRASGDR